ncbi:unnamed protein product [Caretta caretta]
MQENYENVTSLGLPVSKAEVMSQLEPGEEVWVSDLQGPEGRESLRGTCTASEVSLSGPGDDGMVSENKEQNPQQEDAEHVELQGRLPEGTQGNVSRSREERQQGNKSGEKVGKSISCEENLKDLKETTAQQRILKGERDKTCALSVGKPSLGSHTLLDIRECTKV